MTETNRSTQEETARTRRLRTTAAMIAVVGVSLQWAPALRSDETTPQETLDTGSRQVLFAFDDHSIPWVRGVELEMQRPEKHAANPIITRGSEGQPDSKRAYQPAVLRQGDRWRMWYSASDNAEHRVAYAETDARPRRS
jgi:hypothetical protein